MEILLDMLLSFIAKSFGWRVASMAGHKDGKIEPRSKAKHDHRAFEKHKKAR